MADPRAATTSRIGTAPQHLHTYKIDGSDIVFSATATLGAAVVGRAVMLSSADTVRLAGDDDLVLGRLEQVHANGYCSVQIIGAMELPSGDGGAVVGAKIVGNTRSGARGYIKTLTDPGGAYAQTAARHASRGRGVVIDAASADAVEVLLV